MDWKKKIVGASIVASSLFGFGGGNDVSAQSTGGTNGSEKPKTAKEIKAENKAKLEAMKLRTQFIADSLEAVEEQNALLRKHQNKANNGTAEPSSQENQIKKQKIDPWADESLPQSQRIEALDKEVAKKTRQIQILQTGGGAAQQLLSNLNVPYVQNGVNQAAQTQIGILQNDVSNLMNLRVQIQQTQVSIGNQAAQGQFARNEDSRNNAHGRNEETKRQIYQGFHNELSAARTLEEKAQVFVNAYGSLKFNVYGGEDLSPQEFANALQISPSTFPVRLDVIKQKANENYLNQRKQSSTNQVQPQTSQSAAVEDPNAIIEKEALRQRIIGPYAQKFEGYVKHNFEQALNTKSPYNRIPRNELKDMAAAQIVVDFFEKEQRLPTVKEINTMGKNFESRKGQSVTDMYLPQTGKSNSTFSTYPESLQNAVNDELDKRGFYKIKLSALDRSKQNSVLSSEQREVLAGLGLPSDLQETLKGIKQEQGHLAGVAGKAIYNPRSDGLNKGSWGLG